MNVIVCPNCAWENPSNQHSCEHCNCKLVSTPPTNVQQYSSHRSNNLILEPIFCSSCGNKAAKEAPYCPSCGQPLKAQNNFVNDGYSSNGIPLKSRVTAGILALFLGGIGVHKFYCGHIGLGVVYLLFFWTFIPSIIALIEGIIYLTSPNDEVFTRRYCQ